MAQRWHAARLAGTVLVALAAPVVITVIPSLARPLGVIACTWVVAARLALRPAEQSALEARLGQRLGQAARGNLPPAQDLRAIHDEINRQRLAQPPVPDWYYRLRRASYATAMQAAAGTLARNFATSPATGQ